MSGRYYGDFDEYEKSAMEQARLNYHYEQEKDSRTQGKFVLTAFEAKQARALGVPLLKYAEMLMQARVAAKP